MRTPKHSQSNIKLLNVHLRRQLSCTFTSSLQTATMLALRSRPAIVLKDGQRHSQRIAPTKLSRGSLQVVSFVRNERPFRKDYKDQTSIAQDFKRGAKNAQAKGKQVGQQAKQGLQRSRNQVNKGLRNGDFEEVVEKNATIYGFNAVVLATFAGLAAYNPGFTAEIFFQKSFLMSADSAGPALLGPLFQILSLGLSAAAVTNYVQSGGAQVDQLDATLHKRLNASLSTFSIAQLSLLSLNLTPASKSILAGYNGVGVLNATGILALGVGVLLQLYVAGVNYSKNSPEGYNPVADAKSWLKDASNTFKGIDGPFSAGYAALTAGLLGAGIGYIVAPGLTLGGVLGTSAMNGGGPDAIVLWQLIGAGVSMVVAPMAYSLKEAASANVLSDIRFKLLNIAMLTAGAGHWLVLYPRIGDASTAGPLLPVVLGTWALAAALGATNLLQGRERDIDA